MPTPKKTMKSPARRKATRTTSAARTSARTAKGRGRTGAPKGLRLRTAAPSLTVNDVDKSLSWYRDVLGFADKERWEDDGKLVGVEMAA